MYLGPYRTLDGRPAPPTASEIEERLQLEYMTCTECGADTRTVAAEGVPAQALRHGECGHDFFMDLESRPRYTPAGRTGKDAR